MSNVVFAAPVLSDPNLESREYVTGLKKPTTMTFVGDDILVLEQAGNIRLVRNGTLLDEPIMRFNVDYDGESGLIGIESINSDVFIFVTESKEQGGDGEANRIYRFNWNGNELTDKILLAEFPTSEPAGYNVHNGGVFAIGLKNQIYTVVGDTNKEGTTQNFDTGDLSNTSIIVELKNESTKSDIEDFHAIGIRNSFGLIVDPKTGYLWDSENGPETYDEVNLVLPKFNSGWKKIMGPATQVEIDSLPKFRDFVYSDPEFSWERTVGPTAIIFLDDFIDEKYEDVVLVGSVTYGGAIYQFQLNDKRDGFIFENFQLADKVLNVGDNPDEIIFGNNFLGVTDLEIGPDNLIYVVSLITGNIYQISPSGQEHLDEENCSSSPKDHVNWAGCKMTEINLSNSSLRFANLTGVNLSKSNLSGSDLSNAILVNANLSGTNMSKIIINGANLENADISYSNLFEAIISDSNLNNVNFTKSYLERALLRGSFIKDTDFSHTNLTNASFAKAVFDEPNFYGADLSHTEFFRAQGIDSINFDNVIFDDTDIQMCFGSESTYNFLKRILNWAMRQDFFLFDVIEWVTPNLCFPSFHIDPVFHSREY